MSTQKLDIICVNSKNVGEKVIGHFCGSPIRELYMREVELDDLVDVNRTIEANRKTPSTFTADLLPGEIVCTDGIVRRDTTSEAVGYDEFHAYEQPEGTRRVTIAEGREFAKQGLNITFRPDRVVGQEEFAIVHEEVASV